MTAREPMIARRAAQWLEAQGLEVYQEVRIGYADKRADLVGAGAEALVVVECKLRLGLDVIVQAKGWLGDCNACWAAFLDLGERGRRHRSRTRGFALQICEWQGIGVLAIPGHPNDPPEILVPAQIRPTDRWMDRLREVLAPEQRLDGGATEAGTNRGGYHTPFRWTALLVAEIVREHPEGIQVSDLLDLVKERGGHHYASDRGFCSSIPVVVKRGVVPGVKVGRKAFGRRASVLVPVEGGAE